MSKMNLPNKLTVVRALLIPVFLFFFFSSRCPLNYLFALVVFAGASVTDLLDGKIARKHGLVTDFGKLMDPLADKLLVMSAMVCLIPSGLAHALIVTIVLAREFMVTSIRTVAAGKGIIMAADIWGKIKTVLQMIWLCFDLFYLFLTQNLPVFLPGIIYQIALVLHYIFIALALTATVFSGINYAVKNKELFSNW